MADNQEIAVLTKKVYALSTLSLPELLHRLGIADQNRALIGAAVAGGLGLLCGVMLGLSTRKR